MRLSIGQVEKILLYCTIVLLPTQLTRHWWPDFAYVYSLPIDYLAPVIHGWDLLVMIMLVVWLVQRPVINSSAMVCGLVFLLSQSVSLIGASNIGAGIVRLQQCLLIGGWGIYLASQSLGSIQRVVLLGIKHALWWVSLLAIGQFLMGKTLGFWILGERQFDLGNPLIAKFNWFGQLFLRPYATFPHPNVMAGVMMVMLLLLDLDRVRISLTRMMSSLVIGLSFSRVAVGVLLFYWLKRIGYRSVWLWVILLVGLPFMVVRFQSAFNFDYLSVLRREELAEVAVKLFGSAPLLGIGLNNFINQAASSTLISGASRFLQPAHNIILLTLAETGLVGLMGFGVLVGWPVWRLLRLWRNRMSKVLLASWLVIGVLGMFDHYWLTLAQGQRTLWLVWGLSWGLISFKSSLASR